MPIKIPDLLPARSILENENIFVMSEQRASHQDIRPLRILILNLMPTKVATETQLLRALSNTPLQIEFDLLKTATHTSKNTSAEHLDSFYKDFADIKNRKYDGMIITGAPVETFEFKSVDYWDELCEIMAWTKTNVFSTFHICWGAQAALHYHYGISKMQLDNKLFGVFLHKNLNPKCPLLRGFDDVFYAPHSRHTEISEDEILKVPELEILSSSRETGPYIILGNGGRQIFVTGHPEYDAGTLGNEYTRDLDRNIPIDIPKNYYKNDDPSLLPVVTWRAHAHLLYTNWLNYYVYQSTPFNVDEIS